ncbi:DUF4352 domain-containing protein [Nocardiopsis gilva YIM 90087]|uniref:DUF4352 domain-containing protein n=2 Tax=Nocardiopsis gilva TaxID=280236 RepID=A0A223S3V2_9ACTN|nr:DUF4352 domain-containing protein [Nocardiopsis gilva YIM 90087]
MAVVGTSSTDAPSKDGSAAESQDGTAESKLEGKGSAATDALTVGDTGTVDDWKITVTGIDTTDTYGPEYLEEEAQGEFKVVGLEVENVGDEATLFDASALKLEDADGKKYSSQTTIGENDLFLKQINPGNKASGEAVVDVPKGTEITQVVIEDVWSFADPIVFKVEE